MKLSYRHTVAACFMSYIVQTIVVMFVPLLFVTFVSAHGFAAAGLLLLTFLPDVFSGAFWGAGEQKKEKGSDVPWLK